MRADLLRMKRLSHLAVLPLLALTYLTFSAVPAAAQCGVERWSVKTGTDPDAGLVNLNSSSPTTIATLAALPAPNPIPPNNRVQPTETTVWVINATLTMYKLESDSDYHLIIQDSSGNTMITEIPAPTCVGAGSPFLNGITNARSQMDAMFTVTTSFQTANIPVQITGVAMFDFLHGQSGVAPNGIELHPVLDIQFNPSSDFSISSSPGSLSVTQGTSGTSTIGTTISGSFNSSISLSASGLPSGTTASFNPTSIAAPGSGSSTLALTVGSATATGTYPITVTGTGGGKTHSTTVTLTVTAASNPDFSMSTSPGSISVIQGNSGTSTVSTTISGGFNSSIGLSASGTPTGASASLNPPSIAAPGAGSSTLTLAVGASTAPGTYTITVTGTGGGKTHSATVSLTVIAASNPDFSISASPGSISVIQGNSGTSTVSTSITGGFNSPIALSASGMPTGVSAAFNPSSIAAPGSGSSTLTLTVGSSVAAGTYTITATGTGGGKTHSATLTLTVTQAAKPDFSVGAAPSSLTILQGANGTSTITITSLNGFNSATTLSSTGLPSGVTASFSANPITPPANGSATSTLTLSASSVAALGTATVTVTGTSGALAHSTTISLTVSSNGGGGAQTATYSGTLKAPECATPGTSCDSGPSLLLGRDNMTGGAEPNQPNTINNSCADGTSGAFHSDESNDRLLIATTDGSTFAAGKTVTVTATVWAYGTGSSDALDFYYAANANNPTWIYVTTIVPAGGNAQTLSATYTLPSGSLQAVRASFRYQGSASPCSTGSYDDHDDLVFAVSAGAPGFTVGAAPSALSVNQGSSATSTITVTSMNGFNSATTLSAAGLPTGVTASFSANPITPPANGSATSTLTLTASSTAALGAATVTVTGTSGSLTQSTTIGLTVNSTGGGAQTATYSGTLKAPECATVGTSCDSGPTLLLGRDSMTGGPEPNQPNTINNSCADGTSGTFHVAESNDRVIVASTNSGPLTHGNTVTVTITVWAYGNGSSNALDLYYAANANNPVWVYITTIVPPGGGAQTLSATYTLPGGNLQAVRANFRYKGSASVCTKGSYDDHDDLVFAVN